MKRNLSYFLLAMMLSPAVHAQVTISDYTGTGTVISNPISGSYSTPYTFAPQAPYSLIDVSPSATASLATGTFYDGLSYSGTAQCPGCSGGLALYLPNVRVQESFVISGSSPTQVIPWTLTMVETPQFGPASSNVFSDVIYNTFSVGGNVLGASVPSCFSDDGGCNSQPVTSPNNTPYIVTVSGTILSGGTLTFISNTSGASNFIYGPTSSSIYDSLALDPLISVSVPEGVSITSASGVFPVGVPAVPEASTWALTIAGLVLVAGVKRKKFHSSARFKRADA